MNEWYCVVAGSRYGPVSMAELLDWARDGRLSAEDLVWKQSMAEWQPARSIPELAGEANWSPAAAPVRPAAASPGVGFTPHRGGVVLALGIIGLVCCFICGIIAWSMGSADLKEIDAGRIDPSGRGLTQAGKICGIISVVWAIVGIGGWVLMSIFMASISTLD